MNKDDYLYIVELEKKLNILGCPSISRLQYIKTMGYMFWLKEWDNSTYIAMKISEEHTVQWKNQIAESCVNIMWF